LDDFGTCDSAEGKGELLHKEKNFELDQIYSTNEGKQKYITLGNYYYYEECHLLGCGAV
jgi:hypothetical protein